MSPELLLATRKGLFALEPQNGRWEIARTAFLGDNLSMVLRDPRDGAIYAALEHGHFGVKMQKSTDGGSTWTEIATPAYPAQPDAPDKAPKLARVWALEAGPASQPGRLWCGTIPGGLFVSDDGGASWSLVESLWNHPARKDWFGGGADAPGIHSVCVDPRDANHITIGVSCAGVWVSYDGGASWNCQSNGMRAEYMPPDRQYDPGIQDPHLVVHCPSSPDHFWAQHHNGIFRSTDGSKSWSEITESPISRFGFAVAVHPTDPDSAWFVPGIKDEKRFPVNGQVAVLRTRDGGKSFDVLTNGLPGPHAYDLCYRHSLDISGDGGVLAFGSTTGSLWISENGGDTWQTISQNLPPIYAVRFSK